MTTRGQELLESYPPFLRRDQTIQAFCNARAAELDLRDDALEMVEKNIFPITAEEALPLWEKALGLSVANPAMGLGQRKAAVALRYLIMAAQGEGVEWKDLINRAIGFGWTYAINHGTRTLTITTPFDNNSLQGAYMRAFIRSVTPANLTLLFIDSTGFTLGGPSTLDSDTL